MKVSPTTSHRVRFAPGIYEKMTASVGYLEPEHYAVLGGYLHDPHRVTDFMPMPPLIDQRGQYRSSSATVTLNGPFIEYYLNTCLLPFGKFILGIMHSHPSGMNRLSGGIPGSGYGDIPSMRGHLEAARSMGDPWHDFIAPIVTCPGHTPSVDTWIVNLDTPQPIWAETIWETEPQPPMPLEADDLFDILRFRPEFLRAAVPRHRRHRNFPCYRRARDEFQARLLLKRALTHKR